MNGTKKKKPWRKRLKRLIVLLVIEVITLGLSTIWFAGGALASFIAALAGANVAV